MKGYENGTWLWMSYVMAILYCSASTSITTLERNKTTLSSILGFKIVRLDVENLTAETYTDFIDSLRNALRNPNEDIRDWHGFGVLRSSDNLPEDERFILVELSISDATLTLIISVTDVYVIGYFAGSRAHYFRFYMHEFETAFPDVEPENRHHLPFDETYGSLEKTSGSSRENVNLGRDPLQNAVSSLYYDSRNGPINAQTQQRAARDLIVAMQMVSEAARYFIIAGRISTWIHNSESHPPGDDMLEYQNSWGKLSERIQESGENGIFDPIQLRDRANQPMTVSNVNDFYVKFAVALMIYYCRPQQKLAHHHFSPLVIRPVVATFDDVCVNPEDPIVRIVGPNTLCAGVRNGNYNNRQPIVLQHCKSNSDESQLWTFKRNGMIRSKGKCLTCSGNRPGDFIMINDCPSQLNENTKWQVFSNGAIQSGTGLVMSAHPGGEGTILRVEYNINTIAQSWRPTSYTQPFPTSIMGLEDLCLQATGNRVWLDKCEVDQENQTWLLYPDGSIRPQRDQARCLFGDSTHDRIVRIVVCYSLSLGQRWVFRSDGTILNLNYNLVLAVSRSDPSLKLIVISPYDGKLSQKWSPVF